MIRLANPVMLWWLAPVAALAWWLWRSRRRLRPQMTYASLGLFEGVATASWRTRWAGAPVILMMLAAVLIVGALARPQSAWRERKRFNEGIAIMLVLDVSESMRALDFKPNRLEKSKAVVKQFIEGRADDQIGAVIFGRDTFTLCPLTIDYDALGAFVDRVDFDLVNGDGTAIGMGLANAVARLRDADNESRVVIVLTDGENNAGRIDPLTAADMAKQFDMRVYTIGVGSADGTVAIPNPSRVGPRLQRIPSRLDVRELTRMAEMTGGRFFHATDGQSLEEIYAQIDRMERTEIETVETHYFDELAHWLIWPALALLLLALALEWTVLKTFP